MVSIHWRKSRNVFFLRCVAVRDFGSMIIMSVLSQFGLMKLACIHDWISMKQLVRAECVAGMLMDLVEM